MSATPARIKTGRFSLRPPLPDPQTARATSTVSQLFNSGQRDSVTNGKVACMSRLLIADDEDAIRRWLVRNLVKADHEVEEASNGNAAIAALHASSFDV